MDGVENDGAASTGLPAQLMALQGFGGGVAEIRVAVVSGAVSDSFR